jgi:hypothetical protein
MKLIFNPIIFLSHENVCFSLPLSLAHFLASATHNESNQRYALVASNSLRINDVGRDDKGIYQCLVSNAQSSVQASGELKLGGNNNVAQ